jgi:TPP-dependent pyruvate/acetoin dehydrogenase alpha subunit
MITREELIAFETEIGERFNNREIRAPIHLYHGNEDQIMQVFAGIDIKRDWVCCTWRNHYQALLKGVPKDLLRSEIIAGRSMVLNLPEYKLVCSSIVGGIPSIATGLALAAKLQNTGEHVWCWTGDMSAETGAWHEAYKYSVNHRLPITFVVEDNGLAVESPTDKIWGRTVPYYAKDADWYQDTNLIYYRYKNTRYPHAGAGVRVQF